MSGSSFISKLTLLFGGFLIWLLHLTFLYGFHALACARHFAGTEILGIDVITQATIAATVIAVGANFGILVAATRGRGPGISREDNPSLREFWRFLAAVTAVLSLVAVSWSALPVLVMRPCA